MEHLWSRAGATGGKRWQMGWPRERLEQAQTVATGCDQLRPGLDGKEGVDGSSPSEGSAEKKSPETGIFVACPRTAEHLRVTVGIDREPQGDPESACTFVF
jgi:hypothetical protein